MAICDVINWALAHSKPVFIIVNIISMITGLLTLVVGILAKTSPDHITALMRQISVISKLPSAFNLEGILVTNATFVSIFGVFVSVVGFSGCCGALNKKFKALLIIYIVILAVVLCVEVTLVMFVVVAPETFKGLMHRSISEFKEDAKFENGVLKTPNDALSLGWTVLQFETNCCGAYNYTDYSIWPHNVTINEMIRPAAVPISCCATNINISFASPEPYHTSIFIKLNGCLDGNDTYINEQNCYDSVFTRILQARDKAAGIGAAIIGVQLLMIILAVAVFRQFKQEQENGDRQGLISTSDSGSLATSAN